MLDAMPVADGGYRALSGKARVRNVTTEGKPTRTKIDLFPEYMRHLPPEKREVWDVAGRVLRSKELGKVFVERVETGLKRRLAAEFAKVCVSPGKTLPRATA